MSRDGFVKHVLGLDSRGTGRHGPGTGTGMSSLSTCSMWRPRLLVDTTTETVRRDLADIASAFFPGLPEVLLARGMAGWTQLFGLISFEVFGRLNAAIEDRDAYFTYQTGIMADLIGLP